MCAAVAVAERVLSQLFQLIWRRVGARDDLSHQVAWGLVARHNERAGLAGFEAKLAERQLCGGLCSEYDLPGCGRDRAVDVGLVEGNGDVTLLGTEVGERDCGGVRMCTGSKRVAGADSGEDESGALQ